MSNIISLTRLGNFFKVLVTNFIYRVAKIHYLIRHNSSVKPTVAPFWATFGKTRLLGDRA